MVFGNDTPACEIKRDNPMWLWIGSAHLPMDRHEILRMLSTRKVRCSSLVRVVGLFQIGIDWFCQDRLYIMPNKLDELVSNLWALSLTHNIVGMNITGAIIEVAFAESEDHTSNIDADVIAAIVATKSRESI